MFALLVAGINVKFLLTLLYFYSKKFACVIFLDVKNNKTCFMIRIMIRNELLERGRSNLTNLAFWRVVIFMEYITSKKFA